MRLQDIAKRTDAYNIDPRKITVDPTYNVRIDGPELEEANAILYASLKANGLVTPLRVRIEGENPVLVQGHRRLSQIMKLIEDGHPFETVQVLPEPRGTDEQTRTIDLITSNSGHPLSMLEKAEVFKRLLAFGWDAAKIAEKAGITPKQVGNILDLGAAPEAIKELVSSGQVSATTATKLVQSQGGTQAAVTLAEAAAASPGKKVTAGTLKKATAPKAPPPPAQPWEPAFMRPAGSGPTPVGEGDADFDKSPTERSGIRYTPEKWREVVSTLSEILGLDDIQTIHTMVRDTLNLPSSQAA
jgi:ParB family chromosome partitioning protein